jgi:hypothetical protein
VFFDGDKYVVIGDIGRLEVWGDAPTIEMDGRDTP